MAKAFNLADHLAAVASVSSSDTKPTVQILPVRKIFSNENNFYNTSNVDDLVNSILMYGVLDPITVRPTGDGEGYIIISGHRRHRAVVKILDEGLCDDTAKFLEMPCIVRDVKDEMLEELMLIQANSATRILTSAEISRQAERVEELLYRLKEQGYEFPGRMRDNVAAACRVSSSKLARLKVIRDKLSPEYTKYYKKNALAESTAYALAQLPTEEQQSLFARRNKAYNGNEKRAVEYLTEYKVREYKKATEKIDKIVCKFSDCGKCTHLDGKLDKLFCADYSYAPCDSCCCCACSNLASCRNACLLLSDKVAQLKAEKKALLQKEKKEKAEQNETKLKTAKTVWERFGSARRAAGMTAEQAYAAGGMYFSEFQYSEELENGTGEYRPDMRLPLPVSLWNVEKLNAFADALSCSVDYLLGREAAVSNPNTPTWLAGLPAASGLYAAKFECDGYIMKKLAYYDCCLKKFYFDASHGRSIEAACVGWYPIPQEGQK